MSEKITCRTHGYAACGGCVDCLQIDEADADEFGFPIPTLEQVLYAAPNMCWRKCHDCDNTALHVDSVTPWVNCRHCGSQDVRLLRAETAELRGEVVE